MRREILTRRAGQRPPQVTRRAGRSPGTLLPLLLALLAACADAPTAPETATARSPLEVLSGPGAPSWGSGADLLSYPCLTSVATPGGPHRYRYGRLTLRLPRETRAPGGRTLVYRLRVRRADQAEPVAMANCVIPRTRAAIEAVHRRFGVGADARITEQRGGADVEARTQSCVEDGQCELEGLVVDAEEGCTNPDWTRGSDGVCRSSRGDSPGGSGDGSGSEGSWGGGGDGSDGDDPDPGTPPPPCQTGIPVIDSPEVQQGFDDLWSRSGFEKPMAERREQGGWLIARGDSTYYIQPFPVEWSSGPCAISVPSGTLPPNGAIAMVHTHPYHLGEQLTSCEQQRLPGGGAVYINYANQPSGDDYDTMQGLHSIPGAETLIGIIIDNEKITAYNGSSGPGAQTQMDRCGY